MFIYIAGSGAMGCRFGYQLQQAGSEVILLDNWAEHIKTIKEKGLQISGDQELNVKMNIMRPKEASKKADFIILFTKSMQLVAMLEDIKHLIGEDTKVLCLLNGLGHEEVISSYVAKENIIMGVTIWTAKLNGPGSVFLKGQGAINLQSFSPLGNEAIKDIITIMNKANLNVTYDNDVLPSIWRKACVNGVMNCTCALLDCTIGELFNSKYGLKIVQDLIAEFVLVAKAEGVILNSKEIYDYILLTAQKAAHHYPSMHQDLITNKRFTEIDYINGAVNKKAQKYGLKTPYCEFITSLIHAKEDILNIH